VELAVLKVVSDILLAADRGEVTLLCLLDTSAAFDTVDDNVLVDRLRMSFVGLCCRESNRSLTVVCSASVWVNNG
jgi:hypothetical protein